MDLPEKALSHRKDKPEIIPPFPPPTEDQLLLAGYGLNNPYTTYLRDLNYEILRRIEVGEWTEEALLRVWKILEGNDVYENQGDRSYDPPMQWFE